MDFLSLVSGKRTEHQRTLHQAQEAHISPTIPTSGTATKWAPALATRLIRKSRIFAWQYGQAAKQSRHLVQRLATTPPPLTDLWQGDATKGQPLANGMAPVTLLNDDWHDFSWLRDMRDYGGQHARTHARRYVLEWINLHGQWNTNAWNPVRTAHRIKTIIMTWNWFGQSATQDQQNKILTSLIIQANCLAHDLKTLTAPDDRLNAATALLIDHAFRSPETNPDPLIDQIFKLINQIVLSDGCHAKRSPPQHIACLAMLHEFKQALGIIRQQQPEYSTPEHSTDDEMTRLDETISLMGAVGRMWRLGDGGFIAMLSGPDANSTQADQLLEQSGPKGKIRQHAECGGFIRLSSGRSVVILNTAPAESALPAMLDCQGETDAAAGAIEFSVRNQRLIISGGHHQRLSLTHPNLTNLLKGSAAHSTISLDMINAAQIGAPTEEARTAINTESQVGPANGGLLAMSEHNGYQPVFGITCERKLFLATGGNALKGQDTIRLNDTAAPIPAEAIIRFHLHPRISTSIVNRKSVLLKLPGTLAHWQFVANQPFIQLEESITALDGKPQRCQQIVLTIPLDAIRQKREISINWGMMKMQKHPTPSSLSATDEKEKP